MKNKRERVELGNFSILLDEKGNLIITDVKSIGSHGIVVKPIAENSVKIKTSYEED